MKKRLSKSILGAGAFSVFVVSMVFNANTIYAQNVQSATLFFSAPATQVKEGQIFTIDVKINSSLQSINAVSGVLSYPSNLVRVVSLDKEKSIINLWTEEPKLRSSNILFEGIILNPGFQGLGGLVFHITFEAHKAGTVFLNFNEGSILANDGLGTNVLATLAPVNFNITPLEEAPGTTKFPTLGEELSSQKLAILPVITKYFTVIEPKEILFIKGKGEPFALTKIVFEDLPVKSLGEELLAFLQTKKEKPSEVVIKNDKNGIFHYVSGTNLVAGAYSATPFLLDPHKNTQLPGLPIQLLVNESEIVRTMVVILNVMGLLIPILFLGVIIFLIPWYSWRKMRLIKGKMLLEEEKIKLTGEELKRKNPTP